LPVFGWAKPVPVNPNRFEHYRKGTFLVAFAGPLTNFLLACFFAVVFYFVIRQPTLLEGFPFLPKFFNQGIILNLVLAIFNLFPIPPLDGSRVVSALLPHPLAARYNAIEPYGFFIVMGLIALGVFGKILFPIVNLFYTWMLQTIGVYY
jgi:Zn-dependent protease